MDSGLIQFLVIAVFVIISMMDASARKRRKEAQRLGVIPTPDGVPEAVDDLGQEDESSGESEGMVPQDLWGEIAAMARGEMPASLQEQPETGGPNSTDAPDSLLEEWTPPGEDVSSKTPLADLQAGYLHPDQALIHREHASVAVPPTVEPLPEELPHEFVLHSPQRPSEPRKELSPAPPQSLLGGVRRGAKDSLREAIILAEVLSPPVTLRDSGWKPLF